MRPQRLNVRCDTRACPPAPLRPQQPLGHLHRAGGVGSVAVGPDRCGELGGERCPTDEDLGLETITMAFNELTGHGGLACIMPKTCAEVAKVYEAEYGPSPFYRVDLLQRDGQ